MLEPDAEAIDQPLTRKELRRREAEAAQALKGPRNPLRSRRRPRSPRSPYRASRRRGPHLRGASLVAEILGSTTDDPRIADAYDQIVSEWALQARDPDAEYARFFGDGPVATRIDLVAAQQWAGGRVLI